MIFGSRNVRRMLDSLANTLHIDRINKFEIDLALGSKQSLAAEWEVVIGYALSKVGSVRDVGVENSRNPDFLWIPELQPIIVEVTAISDEGLDESNPVDAFLDELRRISRSRGITKHGALSFDFGSVEERNQVLLGIPLKRKFNEFFNHADFKKFLSDIIENPKTRHVYMFSERGTVSQIYFVPEVVTSRGSYQVYTQPKIYNKNPVFSKLKDKNNQVKKSGLEYPAILFICDSDCDFLKSSTRMGGNDLRMRDVVGLFLNGQKTKKSGNFIWQQGAAAQGSRIHAVVWISVESTHNILSVPATTIQLKADIEFANYADEYIKSTRFLELINLALSKLPMPKCTPKNALNKMKYDGFWGGYEMSRDSIKFSALTLQKLLAGEISYEEFSRDHEELANKIKNYNFQGKMLDKAEIEICSNEDDDWIKLSFGGKNPNKFFKN